MNVGYHIDKTNNVTDTNVMDITEITNTQKECKHIMEGCRG